MVTAKPIPEALSEDVAQKNHILSNSLKLGIKVWGLESTSSAFYDLCTKRGLTVNPILLFLFLEARRNSDILLNTHIRGTERGAPISAN